MTAARRRFIELKILEQQSAADHYAGDQEMCKAAAISADAYRELLK